MAKNFSKSNFNSTGSGSKPKLGSNATVRHPVKAGKRNPSGKADVGSKDSKVARPGFHQRTGNPAPAKPRVARPGFVEQVSGRGSN